jgi:uncharacterized repeat protein (TIGR03843 family)
MAETTFEAVLESLQNGAIELEGEFLHGSNYTFLTKVAPREGEQILAVYKPQQGERILWDFPDNTLAHRETAAFLVSQALGWDFVPPTVYREDGPFGPGSVQLFVDHNPNYHYFTFSEEDFQRLKPVALFDLLINNADRKGSHMIFDDDKHLWLIDHGLCFNVEEKLRTVIWDFAGQEIPADLLNDLGALQEKLVPPSAFLEELQAHLDHEEINALARRAAHLTKLNTFPFPPNDRRAYPYPPV